MSSWSPPGLSHQDLRACRAHPHMTDELLSTVRATQPPKGARGSAPCRSQHAQWSGEGPRECPKMGQDWKGWGSAGPRMEQPVEEVYFVCYSEVLSGKVAGALMHTLTHTVSQLTGRGNALHFPAACPQAKPKCQP